MNPPRLPASLKRIKRIAPLQLGKIAGVLYGIAGLVFAPIFLIVGAIGAAASGQPRTGLLAAGVGVIVLFPIIYAVIGFVFGVLGAGLYNLVVRWIGGIEVEVE